MKQFVILSLKHSTENEACFWRGNDAGYTTNPWQAGIYSEEQVRGNISYYNDGYNTIAICINNSSLSVSGISITLKEIKAKRYRKYNLGGI